jgi:hypothetical protein
MKRALPVLAAFALAAVAGAALAQVRLVPQYHYELTNCDVSGTITTNIADGTYLMSFKDEVLWVCTGDAGCSNGGHFYSPGLTMRQDFRGAPGIGLTPISCRSAGATGDIALTLMGIQSSP